MGLGDESDEKSCSRALFKDVKYYVVGNILPSVSWTLSHLLASGTSPRDGAAALKCEMRVCENDNV